MQYEQGLRERLDKLNSERDRIAAKRELLMELIREAEVGVSEKPTEAESEPLERRNGVPIGPTEAILAFVREHPGAKGADVVRGVLPLVTMGAKDRKRNLFSITSTLRRRGRLVREDDGRLFIAQKGGE